MSGIKPSFIASVGLEIQRVRRRCTHIAQGMMRKKLREKLETKNPLSQRIQKILINKSYHNATDTKVISLFLFLSEVAVFFSDYFTAEQIVRVVG